MNHTFYTLLYTFGGRVRSVSRQYKIQFKRYFVLVHPGVPLVRPRKTVLPELEFSPDCPPEFKPIITNLYQQVFKP
jgi:hypothetical protein